MHFISHNILQKLQTNANCYDKQVCIKHEKYDIHLMDKRCVIFQTLIPV